MAWNEPGKGKDPWSGGKGNGGGPPDLEEIWRRFRSRFGGSGGSGGGDGGGSGGFSGPNPRLLLLLVPVLLVVWSLTGLYIVQPGEQGVVLRFGAYRTTTQPGWHWHPPYPIGGVIEVDVQKVRSASHSAVMLTKDENFVDVRVAVQYRVEAPKKYLFNLRDPNATVQQALRSSVRKVVGTSSMDQVIQQGVSVSDLTDKALANVDLKKSKANKKNANTLNGVPEKLIGEIRVRQKIYPAIKNHSRVLLSKNVKTLLQSTLDEYNSGITVTAVNVQYSQPPEQVQGAFEEAIKAREAKAQKKNLARAYARGVVGRAEGDAASIKLQGRGYKQRKIERAKGDAARFSELRAKYEAAPAVTRERLYLETMGDVLSASNLILLGQGKGSPLLYLPLQQLLGQQGLKGGNSAASGTGFGSGDSNDNGNSGTGASSNPDSVQELRSRGREQ